MAATSFAEQVKILAELQKIDTEIHHLRQALAEHPAIQKKLDSVFEAKKVHLKAAEDELKAAQMKQKEKEMDLGSREEKIKKLQVQLYSLKSNKEYQAMELEIKGLKADKSVLEEEILKLMDGIESVRSKVTQEKEALAKEEKVYKDETAALKQKNSQLQGQVAALEDKRKTYVPGVDPKILPQYERILAKRDGLALVPVINNSCGGCHLELPPQVVNEVHMQDKIHTCESCARILYWPHSA